jgi:hypothetical protein
MADIVDVLVLLDLDPFEVSQVLMVQVVLDGRIVAVAKLHAAELPLSGGRGTRMRCPSMSSPTIERARTLDCSL